MNTFIGNSALSSYLAKLTTSALSHHAFLFVGPDHIGKSHVAKAWIQQLGKPECIFLDSTKEDGLRGLISVDDVRDCIDQLSRTTLSGAHRVIVIDRGDELSESASNALLKSLEEPPANTLFIILTTDTANVLPTILSRCFVVRFPLVPNSIITHSLGVVTVTDIRMACNRPGIATRLAFDAEASVQEKARWEDVQYRATHSFADGAGRGDSLDRTDVERVETLLSSELHEPEPHIPTERVIALYDALCVAHRYDRSHMNESRMVESIFV
ncbi:MAG: AAA family ATPase [bacterium]|nr:AAA family ATPase [bacterium]